MNLYLLNEVFTNNFYFGLLNIISIVSVLCGICIITAKNPIVSVLFLIGLFFSIASYLMMLGLNFIGLSYLLVYVGAVSILFLFILMLINVRISELTTDNNNSFILAILIGIILFIPITIKGNLNTNSITDSFSLGITKEKEFSLYTNTNMDTNIFISNQGIEINSLINDIFKSFNSIYSSNSDYLLFVTSKIWDSTLGESSHITSIGSILYTNYPIWLILTSIILLLAMVGTIIITIKQ